MTLLDTGMVSCGTCKSKGRGAGLDTRATGICSFSSAEVCSAQSPTWLKARCFLPHIYSLEGLHDVVVLTSVLCRCVQLCNSASVQRDVAGSNCSSANVGLLACHFAG